LLSDLRKLCQDLFSPMPLKEFDDYDGYWRIRGNGSAPLKRAMLVAEHIRPASTVLDVGCGTGELLRYLSGRASDNKTTGIDISLDCVRQLTSEGYEAHQLDVTSDDFDRFLEPRCFDYIVITEVLEHLPEPEKLMSALKGHFNSELIVSIPNSGFYRHRLRLLFGRFPVVVVQEHVKEHLRFWTHIDFLYWCGHLDFDVISYSPSASSSVLGLDFGRYWPNLFGGQIIYRLRLPAT
jgi:methionine biosynthesis protein MetW